MLLKIITLCLFLSTNLLATEIWMPVSIQVSPKGELSHTIPLPINGNPGPAVSSAAGGGFFPVISGNITHFKRIFAITKPDQPVTIRDLSQMDFSLLPKENLLGYKVIEQDNKSIRFAMAATVSMGGWLGLNATLAAGFSVGKGYLASRKTNTLKEAQSLPTPKIPMDAKTLVEQLGPGDSISFTKNGALFANLTGGMGWLIDIGVGYSVDASWDITLGRPEDFGNKPVVKLTYTVDKNHGGKIFAGNLFSSVSASFLLGKSKAFNYLFDLSNKNTTDATISFHANDPILKQIERDPKIRQLLKPISLSAKDLQIAKQISKEPLKGFYLEKASVVNAFQLAIKGNLILADILSQQKGKFGVTKISQEDMKYVKANVSMGLTVPWIINATWNWGKAYVISDLKNYDENTIVETVSGIYSKEFTTSGIASNDAHRSSVFAGYIQQFTPINEGFNPNGGTRRYAADWNYFYKRNNVDKEKIKKEIKLIRHRIGFQSILGTDKLVDNLFLSENQKNYSLNVEIGISLSNLATDELMNIAEKMDEKSLVYEADTYLDGFVNEYKKDLDQDNFSVAKKELCVGGAGPSARILKECIFTTRHQTKSAMKKAYNALKRMKRSKTDGNYQEFVSAYADFGSGFIKNRFTMKTFLRMLRFVCTPATYHNILRSNPNADERDIQKVCPEKTVTVNGRPSKIPYLITFKIEGTGLKSFKDTLYGQQ